MLFWVMQREAEREISFQQLVLTPHYRATLEMTEMPTPRIRILGWKCRLGPQNSTAGAPLFTLAEVPAEGLGFCSPLVLCVITSLVSHRLFKGGQSLIPGHTHTHAIPVCPILSLLGTSLQRGDAEMR